jgi:tight adherence protein B
MFLLLIFLAASLTVAGIYSIISDLYLRDRSRVSRRVDEEFRKRQRDRAKRSALFKNLPPLTLEAAPEEEERVSWRQRLEAFLEQSGLRLTWQRLCVFVVGGALALGALAGLVLQTHLAVMVGAMVGSAVPGAYVAAKRKARLEKLLAQLPEAFDLMARVIRAGQTISQALQAVADEFDLPISGEFAYCYEQQNLGLPPETALRDLARRTGLVEIKIFVLALVVQQQTGGNLAELLDKLAAVIRERFRIRGRIRALTAEGRLQALILLILPPAMLLLILTANHDYGQLLIDHPRLLVGMFISELLGALWIRRIVNFDF